MIKKQSCASICMPQKCSNWIFHHLMMKHLGTFVKIPNRILKMTLCFSVTRNGKIAALLICSVGRSASPCYVCEGWFSVVLLKASVSLWCRRWFSSSCQISSTVNHSGFMMWRLQSEAVFPPKTYHVKVQQMQITFEHIHVFSKCCFLLCWKANTRGQGEFSIWNKKCGLFEDLPLQWVPVLFHCWH